MDVVLSYRVLYGLNNNSTVVSTEKNHVSQQKIIHLCLISYSCDIVFLLCHSSHVVH